LPLWLGAVMLLGPALLWLMVSLALVVVRRLPGRIMRQIPRLDVMPTLTGWRVPRLMCRGRLSGISATAIVRARLRMESRLVGLGCGPRCVLLREITLPARMDRIGINRWVVRWQLSRRMGRVARLCKSLLRIMATALLLIGVILLRRVVILRRLTIRILTVLVGILPLRICASLLIARVVCERRIVAWLGILARLVSERLVRLTLLPVLLLPPCTLESSQPILLLG
jgi:hypothetical protein